jgi:hypothetical protein
VVIGPNWLGRTDRGGRRRVDRPEDFVRQEVSRALASGIPVVPVLVEEASLPPADELPGDMASLVLRQAVTLRDVSWHSDVDDLIRRLEGDHLLATRRRRWPILVGAGLAAVVAVVVVAMIVRRGDDGGSSDEKPCETDDTWTAVDSVADPTRVVKDGETLEFEVRDARFGLDGSGGAEVVLDVAATNPAERQADTTDQAIYVDGNWIKGLLVNQVLYSEVSCWGPVRGDRSLPPEHTAIVTIGFKPEIDPSAATLALELSDGSTLTIARPT